MLDQYNVYVKKFRIVRDWYMKNQNIDLKLKILENRSFTKQQYIHPIGDEVAVLMIDDGTQSTTRDIIICDIHAGFKIISETHPAYMPLQYSLLFPYDEDD
ncbi:hypothetical protein AXF42_Ash021658 [Apostasia shenzhenica]|uniref:Uncharacterized protein n=1 Tax=Apostasia shenzhenica TaxID=1088818 RepID=A0A2H9ZYK1_9ASPA|nr:hypothetical protein AXF42_Ash021658 [Apostasia shenzhenica]